MFVWCMRVFLAVPVVKPWRPRNHCGLASTSPRDTDVMVSACGPLHDVNAVRWVLSGAQRPKYTTGILLARAREYQTDTLGIDWY